MSKDKESNRGTSRKIDSKWGSREIMDTCPLMVDFITKLLLIVGKNTIIVGKNTILVVYDRLSKIAHFVITTKGMLVEGLA